MTLHGFSQPTSWVMAFSSTLRFLSPTASEITLCSSTNWSWDDRFPPSWDDPVFHHEVLRWPCFPPPRDDPVFHHAVLRWPCFPPPWDGPVLRHKVLRWPWFPPPWGDPVFLHPEMILFSTMRSWDDPVSLHPEMTVFSPTPGPENAMTLFSSTLALLFRLIWDCPVPLGFFNSLLEPVCCPVSVSPGLKYCLPCPIGSTVVWLMAVTLLILKWKHHHTHSHNLVTVNHCQMHEVEKEFRTLFSFHHRELTLLPALTQCEV